MLYESPKRKSFERVERGSAGSDASNISIRSNVAGAVAAGGKVRQMFDERRQKAGVDKSYPLAPLKTNVRTQGFSLDRNRNSSTKKVAVKTAVKNNDTQFRHEKAPVSKNMTHKALSRRIVENNEILKLVESDKNSSESNDNRRPKSNYVNHDKLDYQEMLCAGFDENYMKKPMYTSEKLSNLGGSLPSQKLKTVVKANGFSQRNHATRQNVEVPKKQAVVKALIPRSISSASSSSSRDSPSRSEYIMTSKQIPSSRAPSNNRPSSKQAAKSPVVRDDLAECRYCGRRFATDRLGVHEDICGKTGKKKRKTYDATKHRVEGTELEGYVLKGGKKSGTNKATSKHSSPPKSNWRKTHEEFIAAIRAAKQTQAYVAKGGKLSDLPPPPPSSNPDYVQCPHCGRRFNEAAAQRHIPKCASYEFNKPKNGSAKAKPNRK